MKRFFAGISIITAFFLVFYLNSLSGREEPLDFPGHPVALDLPYINEIAGIIEDGESLFDIFMKHNINLNTLYEITSAAKDVYDLVKIRPGRSYIITTIRNGETEDTEQMNLFKYAINDSSYLKVVRRPEGFKALSVEVPYEKRVSTLKGSINDNLISSVGESIEHLNLAFNLADIFESEIDFVTELRAGDHYRMAVEELWLDGVFKGYGNILAAEFYNNGRRFEAYRFGIDGKDYYFDSEGRSLKKALLRAPLKFRHISSGFSYRRKHPILKIYRPHHGIDYAAPTGAPVSAAGNGTVKLAGWNGQYGKLVVIHHSNGYETYYGHLSRIKKGINKGKRVAQGEVIGYVGSTGLATGPHLHYSVKHYGKFINPLRMDLPRSTPVPGSLMGAFKGRVEELRAELSVSDIKEAMAR